MKIKVIALMVSALLCGSFAYATPIDYTFTNASSFSLGGVSYPGLYLGLPFGEDTSELTFTVSANTDNVFTSGDFYGTTPGTGFILNEIGTTTVSYGGVPLATLTDPMGLVIATSFMPSVYLVDETNGNILLEDQIANYSYNGVTSYPGTNLLLGSNPGFESIGTSVGPLTITSYDANQGQFSAALTAAPAVPEPSAIVLLSTGLLGFAGVFRRRLFAN